jgi:hypothetical protein
MSDLVLYNDELITFQNPDGISVYKMSGELELIGSATGRPHYEIVDQNIATVPPHRKYVQEWYNGNIYEDNVNIYAFKVNYCELEKNIGPYGSSGTGLRKIPSGEWTASTAYTGKVKEGSYFNLRYNDSANFHFGLNWSAVVIPCNAAVTYGTYDYMYRCSDFISKSGSTASRIYTAGLGSSGNVYPGGWNIPLTPSSFSLEYDRNVTLKDSSRSWQEEQESFNSNAVELSAFENYQYTRWPMYVYQIFGAANSQSYERYSEITASGGSPQRDYSYSALKMWAGQWSGTISAIDVPEFIVY